MSSSPTDTDRSRATPTNYARILREQWPIVVFAVVLCLVAGIIGQRLVSSSYTAQNDLLISPIDNADNTYVGVNVFRSVSADPTSNVLTLARYSESLSTAQIVKRNLNLRDSPESLLGRISAVPLSQTNIVSIHASASTPLLAARLADAFANATLQRRTAQIQSDVAKVIGRLQEQIGRSNSNSSTSIAALQDRVAALRSLVGLPDPTVSVLNHAEVPTTPNKPSLQLVAIASVLAGLLLGFGAALLNDSGGGKIRREDDLVVRDRLPILARVPRLSRYILHAYIAGRTNLPPAAWEAYRTLRTNILRSVPPGETPVVLLTSAMPGEGKTLTAVNLAITLAAQDLRVVLVDGDFRRPMVASVFGLATPKDGFTTSFIDGDVKAGIRQVPGYGNLKVLLPSLADMTQIDQLDTKRVDHLFETLRAMADVVVVDSAPATEVSDALLLASAADVTLIAVRLGYTRRTRFDSLRQILAQYGVTPSGLVVTTREPPSDVVHGSTMPVPIDLAAPRTDAARTASDRPRRRTRANQPK
jgi:receptor protein-tyrosine kinase